MSAKLLFDTLQNTGICGAKGNVYFKLHNIKTIVRDNSIIVKPIELSDTNFVSYLRRQASKFLPTRE